MIDKGEEFMWYSYLEATKSEPVPDVMFPHVEKVLQNGITVGMALEVPLKNKDNNTDEHYWVAKVTMVCGPLLELQYYGCDDKTKRVWFDLTKEVGHELGWCYKNEKKLIPPISCAANTHVDKLDFFIKTVESVPSEFLIGGCINMMTRIKQGMKLEICDPLNPYRLWMATIIENIGGRLLLRYDTPGSVVKDFWIFCTSELIHDYGFAKKSSSPWFLDPPSSIKNNHSSDEWIDYVKNYLLDNRKNNVLFVNEQTHDKHAFREGMKLEALSPTNYTNFYPATVTTVFDDTYFLVSIDESIIKDVNKHTNLLSDTKKTWLCTIDHPYIFPKNWAKRNNIKLTLPTGWINNSDYFDWDRYLKETNSVAADESLFYERENAVELGYDFGMRLEAADPLNESHICAAHITKIIDDLLFVKLDSEDNRADHVFHIHSPNIFPVGWCEANQYPLNLPRDYKEILRKKIKEESPPAAAASERTNLTKIYFNSRCSTGPMISKSKLTTLPKSVGPGPVDLVLKEVLTMLVSVGYNSARVLKVLQCDTPLEPGYNLEMLKVKQKNNRYHASVAVVNDCEMVEEFCRNICKKILVCPNLFGPNHITDKDQCPEKCRKSRGRGKWIRKRGRQPNKDKNASANGDREGEREDDSSASDASQHIPDDDGNKTSSNPSIKKKLLDNSDDMKHDAITSDTSEGSNNDRLKRKESNGDSSSTKSSTKDTVSPNLKSFKRKHEEVTEAPSYLDYIHPEYIEIHKRQRRPKTLRLDSNPLYWSVDEVYNYLRKTNDCKDIAQIVKKEEIDGMAFLLLNLPTLIQHMKLNQNDALKLCRHIEQVKVTFFLRHINDPEPNL